MVKKADAAKAEAELDTLMSIALAGASELKPKTERGLTTLYGEFQVENTNIFLKCEQVSELSPHVFIPLAKLGLMLISGLRLESKDEAKLKAVQEWAKKVKFTAKAQGIAQLMVRDGTTVVYLPKGGETGQAKWIKELEILPMRYTTLLPDGVTAGDRPKTLVKGEVTRAILNERQLMQTDEVANQTYNRDEIALFRIFHEGYFMEDIMLRLTYGIYGLSMLKSIDRSVKNLMDLVDGYAGYMRRYGVGRLHIDVRLVEELRKQGKNKEAKELLEQVIAAQRRLKANEDIVSGGVDVKTLATGQATGIDTMKQSLETDIHIGLLQAPLSMGKASGTTYAAGYMSEEDRYLVLESLQNVYRETLQTEILDKQLIAMGFQAGDVKVVVDKLDQPYVTTKDVADAHLSGAVTEGEYRKRLGYPEEKPIPAAGEQKAKP